MEHIPITEVCPLKCQYLQLSTSQNECHYYKKKLRSPQTGPNQYDLAISKRCQECLDAGYLPL